MQSNDGASNLVRLSSYIAARSHYSRRQSESLIEQDRVRINGKIWTQYAIEKNLLDSAEIFLDGKVLQHAPAPRLWAYIKGRQELVTWRDPQNRPTVFETLRTYIPQGPLWSAGRLDWDSEGLLLCTNVASIAHALETQPWPRTYYVWVRGILRPEQISAIQEGWRSPSGINYAPWKIRPLSLDRDFGRAYVSPGDTKLSAHEKAHEGASRHKEEAFPRFFPPHAASLTPMMEDLRHWARETQGHLSRWCVTLTQGKNREIREVFQDNGCRVERLVRMSYGPVFLQNLPWQSCFELSPRWVLRRS